MLIRSLIFEFQLKRKEKKKDVHTRVVVRIIWGGGFYERSMAYLDGRGIPNQSTASGIDINFTFLFSVLMTS